VVSAQKWPHKTHLARTIRDLQVERSNVNDVRSELISIGKTTLVEIAATSPVPSGAPSAFSTGASSPGIGRHAGARASPRRPASGLALRPPTGSRPALRANADGAQGPRHAITGTHPRERELRASSADIALAMGRGRASAASPAAARRRCPSPRRILADVAPLGLWRHLLVE